MATQPLASPTRAAAKPIDTDALVIGAGPIGLFQVFELGLHALHAEVIDVLPAAGGQCAALYPDKPIYDIPSVTRSTGRELVANLLRQVAPFAPGFHFGQLVTRLARNPDGTFGVATSTGTEFNARTVFIAAGVGAFRARGLTVEGLDEFAGSQVFTDVDAMRPSNPARVVVVGGDEAAVEAVLALAERGSGNQGPMVTLLHRRSVLQAEPARLAVFEALRQEGRIAFEVGQIGAVRTAAGRLVAVEVTGSDDGATRQLPLDALLVMLGLSPKLGPIADWGLALQRKQLSVDTAAFQTSEPGIFAVGDINTYPGKRKLIVSGFHEATLAAFAAAAYLAPGERIPLEYTTASPRLHALLGVGGTA